ncbi:pyruvate, phosphate dikinase [Thomasclavelia cocleata]|uniref:Pyruvate, phosphate dikinase n=6 Tax=Bacillota TaxID=1239 RepID=A0A1I0HPQ0_9FIRM|nr:pyruvate, phosphate dikinase [Thomasclavelia cocleata]MCR1961900.1 pyruvate, phosphate dikinase [Thomasclavelia cocleata]NDO42301.1 pyruvate, phosphate dikinase [Thomasclavelia cocleata]PJN80991.1 pyruvate, phosphate dikinase [Thomasclavelia cocleata]SET85981.1 pyruvate phosphate dikinase [Thomasclavelia cocleata]GFI41727.1 pyruvate, phosphate dikinase [Thomasclavelia cocleata]
MKKYVYMFSEGNEMMRDLLGGKGANLAAMVNLGLPVPQGFTVTTEACNEYYADGKIINDEMKKQIDDCLERLEKLADKKLGGLDNPLLVSVRSGAKFSMPGMMDTILNLGLNDETVEVIAKQTGNRRFAFDSYRRFIQMYSDVVCEVDKELFEAKLTELKTAKGYESDLDITADDFENTIIPQYKEIFKTQLGRDFPQEAKEQLMGAILAVFRSWNNDRAIIYRNLNGIPHDLGTAVNVQQMVFGNMGDDSGTGVLFTRNAANGDNHIYGEYLINAQGEDVVAGIRTPQKIAKLEEDMPEIYKQLVTIVKGLEKHYKDMQDCEFTVENGKLYILQTRNGKRTGKAALKIAVDLVHEGLINKYEAMTRVEPDQISQLLHPNFTSAALAAAEVLIEGLPASPGAGAGKVYLTAEKVHEQAVAGEKVILVRHETSPEDIQGMVDCEGILTSTGGMTSHAAVVARGMGKCCIVGAKALSIDYDAGTFTIDGKTYPEGTEISLDGTSGKVYMGILDSEESELTGDFAELMSWADEIKKLQVRANADSPRDAAVAIKFGAEGIGLCRTEHMFFEGDRIEYVRQMILSDTVEERIKALDELYNFQVEDFRGIYRAMVGLPVTVRLLDPPLHEFLPHTDEEYQAVADKLGKTLEDVKTKGATLKETNPMLGHRGSRLAVTYPEIYNMQVRAIIDAAIDVERELGCTIVPEIMLPLIGSESEIVYVKENVTKAIDAAIMAKNAKIEYKIGTMIEIPRAALTADEIAKHAEFFSFGTNDLTQMTFGFSRDDVGSFLPEYINRKVIQVDPFVSLDQSGVGQLVEMAASKGRSVRPNIKLGICGEHGGDPESIKFCHKTGLSYVSCSPYRVLIARLAAAQAAAEEIILEHTTDKVLVADK